jgi:hypothetical protein
MIIIADEFGRSYLINANDGLLIHEFLRIADTISAIDISEDGKLCAIGNYSGIVIVISLINGKKVLKVEEKSPVEAIKIADNNDLIVAYRNNTIIRHDISNDLLLAKTHLEYSNDWATTLFLTAKDKVVFIGTKNSQLITLHTKSLKPIFAINLQRGGITAISQSDHFFIIGFSSGNITMYHHKEYEEEFLEAIALLDIEKAGLLLQKNIFLITHEQNRLIYDHWYEKKDIITLLLSQAQTKEAFAIAKPFLYHPKCQMEFEQLQEKANSLMLLSNFIQLKDYKSAYELAHEQEDLKESIFYKRLETIWENLVKKMLKELTSDPINNKDSARKIVADFELVAQKKMMIDTIIDNAHTFIQAKQFVEKKEFKRYFDLTTNYPFLQQTLLHQKILTLSNQLIDRLNNHIKAKEYAVAKQIANVVENFTPVHQSALRAQETIQTLTQIENALASNNIKEALRLEFESDIAGDYETLHSLRTSWQQHLTKLTNQAKKGQSEAIFEEAKALSLIPTATQQIKPIFKELYLQQIKSAYMLDPHSIDWRNTIEQYCRFFAFDERLEELLLSTGQIELIEIFQSANPLEDDYIQTIVLYNKE